MIDLTKLSDDELMALDAGPDVSALMPALIAQESGGRPGAIGPQTRYGRAQGLTQMLPDTAREQAQKLGIDWRPDLMTAATPEGADYQRKLGEGYLAEGMDATGNPRDALRYYHGGPDRALWGPKTDAYADEVLGRIGETGDLSKLSDEELLALDGAGAPAPAAAPPAAAGPVAAPLRAGSPFVYLGTNDPLNGPQTAAYKAMNGGKGPDMNARPGSDAFPLALKPGTAPQPGSWFVDMDGAVKQAPAVDTGEDMLRAIPAGLGSFATSALGMVGDMRGNAEQLGKYGAAALMGLGVPKGAASFIGSEAFKLPLRMAPMVGSQLDYGLNSKDVLGLLPKAAQDVVTYQPKTVPGQYTKTVAEFAPGVALMPGSAAQRIAGTVLPALTSETAGQMTKGTDLEGPARFLGGLAGGALTLAPMATRPLVRGLVDPFTAKLSTRAAEQQAGSRLFGAASDPKGVIQRLAEGEPEILPGSQPTTFQQTGDMGLGALERRQATKAPEQFNQRRAEQSGAERAALEGVQSGGDASDIARLVRREFDALDQKLEADHLTAQSTAFDRTSGIGGTGTPEGYGFDVRSKIDAAEQTARAAEAELWSRVDPDRNLTGNMNRTREAATQIQTEMARTAKPMGGEEGAIFDLAAKLEPLSPVDDLIALRSRLSTEMRNELGRIGRTPAYGRMSGLRDAIQENLETSIQDRVLMDDAAVKAGTMAPENTISARLANWRNDLNGSSQAESGRGVVGLPDNGPREGAPGASGLLRAEGEAGGRLGNPPGGPGLQTAERPLNPAPGGVSAIEGAASPDPIAVKALLDRHGVSVAGDGPNGPILEGLKGKWSQAVEALSALKTGDALGVLYHSETGPIDVVWGRDSGASQTGGFGLAKILAKHPEIVADLPNRLARMEVVERGPNRFVLTGDGDRAVVSRDWAGDPKTWLLSAYEKGQRPAGTIESGGALPSPARYPERLTDPNMRPAAPSGKVEPELDRARADVRALRVGAGKTLFQAVAEKGGLQVRDMNGRTLAGPDVAAALQDVQRPGLINNRNGLPPERMAQALADDGWFGPGVGDASKALETALGMEARGRKVLHPENNPGQVERLRQVEREAMEAGVAASDRPDAAARKLADYRAGRSDWEERAEAAGITDARMMPEDELRAAVMEREAIQAEGRKPGETDDPHGDEFDRLARTRKPSFDEDGVARLAAATEATRERAAIFGQPPISPVTSRAGMANLFRMPDGSVPSKFFHGGSTGFEHMQAAIRAAPDSLPILEDYAAFTLRRAAMTDKGTLDPAKFSRWRAQHENALRALPRETQLKFADAAVASQTAIDLGLMRTEALKQAQAGAIGKLLDSTAPQDVVRTVGNILTSRTAVTDMRALAQRARRDPEAMNGLRQAIADHIANKYVSNVEAGTSGEALIQADGFQTFIRQNREALGEVFKPDELKTFDAIAENIRSRKRSETAVKLPGASNTAQDSFATLKERAAPLIRPMLDLVGLMTGHAMGGPVGGMAGAIGAELAQGMRAAGIERVDQLVTRAMLEPKVAEALMRKAPNERVQLANSRALLRALGIGATSAEIMTMQQYGNLDRQ